MGNPLPGALQVLFLTIIGAGLLNGTITMVREEVISFYGHLLVAVRRQTLHVPTMMLAAMHCRPQKWLSIQEVFVRVSMTPDLHIRRIQPLPT